MKTVIIAFAMVLFLTNCGREKPEMKVSVSRGLYNQPTIRVSGGFLNRDAANLMLMSEQGYVMAQDRFMQMDMLRRLASGRSGELLGKEAKEKFDVKMIAMGLPIAIENSLKKLQRDYPETNRILMAFSNGVNRFLSQMSTARPELVRQYADLTGIAHYQPTPWSPYDSVAIMTSIEFFLSNSVYEQASLGIMHLITSRFSLNKQLDTLKIMDMRPIFDTFILNDKAPVASIPALPPVVEPEGLPFIEGLGSKLVGLANVLKEYKQECRKNQFPVPSCTTRENYGSNNWVVSKDFAGGKETFMANDPHLPITFPTTLYEVALDSTEAGGDFQTAGVQIPGAPGILIGHNSEIAWSLTNNPVHSDDTTIDVFNEEGTKIRLGPSVKSYQDVKTIRYDIAVREPQNGGKIHYEPLFLRVSDQHGVYFSDHIKEIKKVLDHLSQNGISSMLFGGNHIGIANKWTGHQGSTEFPAILGINRAKNFVEFKDSLKKFEVGIQNFIYANRAGDIGYYSPGLRPMRPYLGAKQPPFALADGRWGKQEWSGFSSEVPELYNPNKGFIVTANNDPTGYTSYQNHFLNPEYYSSAFYSTGTRARRITDLIEAKRGNLKLKDMGDIQQDSYDLLAQTVVDKIIKPADIRGSLSPKAQDYYDQILTWDYWALRDRKAPVVFYQWMMDTLNRFYRFKSPGAIDVIGKEEGKLVESGWREAIRNIFVDDSEEGEFRVGYIAIKTLYHSLVDQLADPKKKETARKILIESMEDTVLEMKKRHKENMTWGTFNALQFYNPLDKVMPLVLHAPLMRDGAYDTVNVAGPGFGPNLKLIMVLSKDQPIRAYNSMPGGNWSSPLNSRIYEELLMWRDGVRRPMVHW